MKLYTWQRECLKAWESSDFHGIVHVATGAGKTVLAIAAIDRFLSCYPKAKIRIVVPTVPLARQWQTALLHHEGRRLFPAFFGAGVRSDPDSPVMIYIINSARESLAGHIRKDLAQGIPVLLICDECHHCQSPVNRKIFRFKATDSLPGSRCATLGLSATPFGTAHDDILTDALGPEIFRYDFEDAVKAGIVSSFTVGEISVSFLDQERLTYEALSDEIRVLLARLLKAHPHLKNLSAAAFMKEVRKIAQAADMDPSEPASAFLLKTYERKEISALARARIQCGLSLIESLSGSERILVFCERISQTEEFAALLRRRQANLCAVYHSGMTREARERNMQAFRDGAVRILVACRCLDEGIDVPDASVGIVLSCSAIPRQRIQRLGRILRRSRDKASACLYYLFIRESVDDPIFLRNVHADRTFSLSFSPKDRSFSSDLYEYVAAEFLREAKEKGMAENSLRELRKCLVEGLPRSDCLLPPDILKERIKGSHATHEANYWKTMLRVHNAFSSKTPEFLDDHHFTANVVVPKP